MKNIIIEIVFTVSFFCHAVLAQENLQLQKLNTSCDTLILQVWTWFPFGYQTTCPNLSGFSTNSNTDTLTVLLYYDISGAWPQVGCETTDTITFNVSSNLKTLQGITHSINSGDTSMAISISTIALCATGIPENQWQKNIFVYPNPFSTQTTLQADNLLHNATLTVDNCFGQTVKQIKNISGQTITFHRDNLPSGLYFIRLTQDSKVIATKKLLITD